MATKLETRRDELAKELAALEEKAKVTEERAGEALAEGKSVQVATAELSKIDAQLRVTRAAIAAVDAGLVRERQAAEEAEARAQQERAEKAAREGKALMKQLYRQLQAASETCAKIEPLHNELYHLTFSGKAKGVPAGLPTPAALVARIMGRMTGVLKNLLTEAELAELGLKR